MLKYQLLRQGSRINQVLEDWRGNDENLREMYKHISNSNAWLSTRSGGEQMYIDHITVQVKKIVHESRRMSEQVQTLVEEYYPKGNLGQCLKTYWKKLRDSMRKSFTFMKQIQTY